jgi:hypothetical protein
MRAAPVAKILGRLNFAVTIGEVFVGNSSVADDATEKRLTFLLLYEKVKSDFNNPFNDPVYWNSGSEWRYQVPPRDILRRLGYRPAGGAGAGSTPGGPAAGLLSGNDPSIGQMP